MKTYKTIVASCLIMAFSLLINSCKKAHTDFTIDKNDYSAGDVITISNQTKNIKTYNWTLKYNSNTVETYSDASPNIRISPCALDGNYSLTLDGKTKHGATSTTTKEFLVKSLKGKLYIYSSRSTAQTPPRTVEIKADNVVIGNLNLPYGLTVNIAVGLRYLTTSDGKSTTLNILENGNYSWDIDQ